MPLLTPTGVVSAKHSKGRTWRRHMRMEKIARLTASGLYSLEQIGIAVGLAAQTVAQIRMTAEFQAKMIEIQSGVLSEFDKSIREEEGALHQELKSMVPLALLGLRNAAMSRNPNVALKASMEILDRDGKLAKVSRITVSDDRQPDMTKINSVASDIMALLGRPVGGDNNQTTVMDSFTRTAKESSEQLKTMENNIGNDLLDSLDMATAKPN